MNKTNPALDSPEFKVLGLGYKAKNDVAAERIAKIAAEIVELLWKRTKDFRIEIKHLRDEARQLCNKE